MNSGIALLLQSFSEDENTSTPIQTTSTEPNGASVSGKL